jgi:hypothetical protein
MHWSGKDTIRFASRLINLKRTSAIAASVHSDATLDGVEVLEEITEGRLGDYPDQSHLQRVAHLDLELL